MNDKITMIEIFAGIGAQERSLRQILVPYEITAIMDVDKDAILSYATMRNDFEKEFNRYNFPNKESMVAELQSKNIGFNFSTGKYTITNSTNITKVKQYYLADKLSKNLGDVNLCEKLPYADIVFHSSPCQSFSQAGKGSGGDEGSGTTSSLMWESLRLIETSKPKYIIWENVSNVLSPKHQHNFIKYLEKLTEFGYESNFDLLNSKHYGIPQSRLRIFCVSHRIDDESYNNCKLWNVYTSRSGSKQAETVMEEVLKNDKIKVWKNFIVPETISPTTRLTDMLESQVDEKYYLSKTATESYEHSIEEKIIIPLKRGYSIEVQRQEDNINGIGVLGNYSKSGYNATQIINKNGIAPTVRENHGQVTAILEKVVCEHRYDEGIRLFRNDCCGTIRTIDAGGAKCVVEFGIQWRIRKLTPRECWRLMGFTDDDFDKAAKYMSDSALYKQAGNSICTCCLIAIFNSLLFKDSSDAYTKYLVKYNTKLLEDKE